MSEVERIFEQSGSVEAYVDGYVQHVRSLLAAIEPGVIARFIDILSAARTREATVFVLGNGGSAATASHFSNDLLALTGRPALRVWCLSDSAPVLTARANDCGFDQVFVRQLDGRVRAGDVVVAISSSGSSQNVLLAVDLARACGATTVGLCGFSGGALAHRCDHVVLVATQAGEYGPVEGVHAVLCHVVANHLMLSGMESV